MLRTSLRVYALMSWMQSNSSPVKTSRMPSWSVRSP